MPKIGFERIYAAMDVILRVPPIFVIDTLFGLQYGPQYDTSPNEESGNYNASTWGMDGDIEINQVTNTVDFAVVIVTLATLAGAGVAFLIFLLPIEHLIRVYRWLASIGAVIASCWANSLFITGTIFSTNDDQDEQPSALFGTTPFHENITLLQWNTQCVIQIVFAVTFCYSYIGPKGSTLEKLIAFSFFVPIFTVAFVPEWVMWYVILGSALFPLSMLLLGLMINLRYIYQQAVSAVRMWKLVTRHYGVMALLETEWIRLSVPSVLRIFWLTRATEQAFVLIMRQVDIGTIVSLLNIEIVGRISKEVMVKGCDTVVAILGMTSIVASISHYIGVAMQLFLRTEDEEEKSIGTISAILFFILALQTGLTNMNEEKRYIRLYRNFCLLFTAILHFIHNMVNPLLMSLSASRNLSISQHSRALITCAALLITPSWLLFILWSHHPLSTWLLAVSAFSIEVMIKVVISLLIYALFMIDAHRNTFWEKLDDYVYYIRATGNTIEFIFGIFLFFNGAWILVFESGGTIRACMMCIHAYFNIWLQAKAGWDIFMKRRTAVNKINSLPEASESQLKDFDDVCAICYQELLNARITTCNHYFHGVCLRKWLYIQDRCPLCHVTLHKTEGDQNQADNQPANDAELVDANVNNDGDNQINDHPHQL